MHLSLVENILWAFGTALKVVLCILVFYRRLYTRLAFFFIYVCLLVAEVTVVWSGYRMWGYDSRAGWYTYWLSVGVLLLARGLVVAELCWTSFRNYPAIWSFLRYLLALIAVIVLACAAVAAYQNKWPVAAFVMTSERGLEISILVVLVAMLGLAVRYEIAPAPLERNITVGLGLYSTFQVLNDSFMDQWMTPHFGWWNSTRVLVFDAALLVWIVALWKPIPPPERPTLLSTDVSQHFLQHLRVRIRQATEELKKFGKSSRK
jgi:hypothetical protein